MLKHFIFDKLSDKKNRLKIALQVSKLGFSPTVKLGTMIYVHVPHLKVHELRMSFLVLF